MLLPKNAKRVHLYNVENVLKPRGSMEKESLGLHVYEKIKDALESWTDEKFGDSVDPVYLLTIISENIFSETSEAFQKILEDMSDTDPKTVSEFRKYAQERIHEIEKEIKEG